MDPHALLDQIRQTLTQLRQDPKTQRRFPRSIWESIVELSKTLPANVLCQELHISPDNLRTWMKRIQEPETLSFQEISTRDMSPQPVIVEITTPSGLQARVQCHPSCLCLLYPILRG
jgi:hypothetical protein